MELYQLEYFCELCRCGSFTKTARTFHVTQPAITAAIKKLEQEFGAHLFDHRSKFFNLTPMGKTLRRHAETICSEVEAAKADMARYHKYQQEVIKFGMPMTLCPLIWSVLTSEYVSNSMAPWPLISQAAPEYIADAITMGSLDLGIICAELAYPELETEYVCTVELWAFFSPEHKFNHVRAIRPEMLSGERLLLPGKPIGIAKCIHAYLSAHSIDAQCLGIGNVMPNDARPLANAGDGIAFLEKHTPSESSAPLDPPMLVDLVLAWRSDKILTKAEREFANFIISCARRNEH